MKIKKYDVGRWVQVDYDEGRMDGLLVSKNNTNDRYVVFFPNDGVLDSSIRKEQILQLGQRPLPTF